MGDRLFSVEDITLISQDGVEFQVPIQVGGISDYIRGIIDGFD